MTEVSAPAAPALNVPSVTVKACFAFSLACTSVAVLIALPEQGTFWSPAAQLWAWALYSVAVAAIYFVTYGRIRHARLPYWRTAATVVAAACAGVVVTAYATPAEVPVMMVFGHAVVAAFLGAWALFPGWILWRRHLVR
ncbi:hypothetical protein [Zhihengliuella salsuginis]|uniref:Transmembrane protein n=1 Tax=Zhihengliuella salsuginis TaxID=578222 RepID=A0ABQ3GKW6_9MICC|nr:hypothetical protein [Zhihengliuella salsuginis]GHD13329.1 hypothetical protein GCM10008096_29390 [Zhihengliuella salsuginis]